MAEKIFDNELIEKAKEAKSAEELIAMAKEKGVELTKEQAEGYFAQLNPASGEMSDDELDAVAGGGCGSSKPEDPANLLGKYVRLIGSPVYGSGKCRCEQKYGYSRNCYLVESYGATSINSSKYYTICCVCCNSKFEVEADQVELSTL